MLQVRHLSLHFNALTSLPAGLAGATSLVWLSLNANRLTQLPGELCTLPDLQRLSLHINQVCVTVDDGEGRHWQHNGVCLRMGLLLGVCVSGRFSRCTLTRSLCVLVNVGWLCKAYLLLQCPLTNTPLPVPLP
jgi:Leucine-rich repeat (LRR) protein